MTPTSDDSGLHLTTIVIPSDLSAVKQPEQVILQETERHGYNEETIFAIKLTLEEAVTNAIKHGNKCDPSKKVTIQYCVDDHQTVIYIKDEGQGFVPDEVPDPTDPNRLSLPSGRGILLMRAYMDDVEYQRNGTQIFLRKLNVK